MIEFVTENVVMPQLDFDRIRRWVVEVSRTHGRGVGKLCYCFCDDPYILQVNNQFLHHDYFTDIITFDNTIGTRIAGDLLISLDTVRSNAEVVGSTYDEELLRVIIHGILHLCGINDKGPGEREIMEAAENAALAIY
jgi:rRNA maturation RNase YbeY